MSSVSNYKEEHRRGELEFILAGSFSDQAGRVYSICISACVGLPGVGAGPTRGMWEGQVALVRPWAAFGRPRGLERGHSGGPCTKWGSEGAAYFRPL